MPNIGETCRQRLSPGEQWQCMPHSLQSDGTYDWIYAPPIAVIDGKEVPGQRCPECGGVKHPSCIVCNTCIKRDPALGAKWAKTYDFCPECGGVKHPSQIVCQSCIMCDETLGAKWAKTYEFPYGGKTGTSAPPELRRLHDLLDGMSSAERKKYPVYSGFDMYFRDAIFRVARVSYDGNQKHNPGEAIHWARGKSDDHTDCNARHALCNDLEVEAAEAAWRALAYLQLLLEQNYNIEPPPGVK